MSKFVLGYLATAACCLLLAGTAAPASAATTSSATALGPLTSVSCASRSDCWAGASDGRGAAVLATTDGGAVWHVDYTTTRFDTIEAIDCAAVAHCVAVAYTGTGAGNAFLETADGGTVWTTHAPPRSLVTPEAVSCPTGADCWAIGLAADSIDGVIARTTDGGAVWTTQRTPRIETAMANTFGLSCPSTRDCVATGEGVLTTTDGGGTWPRHAGSGEGPLGPLACPSTRDCYAVADVTSAIPANEEASVYASTDGGSTWKEVLRPPAHVMSLGLSCPSTSRCVAAGGGYTPEPHGQYTFYGLSETTADGGRTWSKVELPVAQSLYADSCVAATTDCVAVGARHGGTAGVILRSTDDGARWASDPVPAP